MLPEVCKILINESTKPRLIVKYQGIKYMNELYKLSIVKAYVNERKR